MQQVVTALAVSILAAIAADAVTVVGTGDPAIDVPAVQAAADQGGVVTLSGTFDFGTHAGNHIIVPGRAGLEQDVRGQSTVFIYLRDVIVQGETDEDGNLLTTIRNGMPPFWIGWDGNVTRDPPSGIPGVDYGIEYLPQDINGVVDYRDAPAPPEYAGDQTRYAVALPFVSATIQLLRFEYPWHYAMKATRGHDIAYLNNEIRNVQWALVNPNDYVDATEIAGGMCAFGMFYAPFINPGVIDNVVMQNNRVENSGTEIIDTHAGECFGFIAGLSTARLTITDNEARNIGRDPSGAGPSATACGIAFFDLTGGAPLIENNAITNAGDIGIWDLAYRRFSPAALIAGNSIATCPAGITAQTQGPATSFNIRSNRISNCSTALQIGMPSGAVVENLMYDCTRGMTAGGSYTIEKNTIVDNSAEGVVYSSGSVTSFSSNIVAQNGSGVRLPATTSLDLVRCNDVWNNAAGNWSGISEDPTGDNGNFSADPLFCIPLLHDYTLAAISPCMPGNNPYGADCDTVGALGQGCLEPMGVDDDGPVSDVTSSVRLLGPWPSPSAGIVRFGVVLDHPSPVRAILLDVSGRAVATLLDEALREGAHIVSWNSTDSQTQIPGGIYYLRLDAGGRTKTGKLTVIR